MSEAAPQIHGRWGAIVLAAGASSRLGQSKQLVAVDGRPLVVRAAEAALAGGLWPVVVVVGANAAPVKDAVARLPLLVVENAAWSEGMASSLRTGIGILGQFSRTMDGTLIAVCDQPAFTSVVVGRLRGEQAASGRGIAAARYAGRVGVPALFRRDYFAALARLTGDQGARAIIAEAGADVVAVELPELALDLDTPADLDRIAPEIGGRANPTPPSESA
jgi:CTP:molybdopterin cytidylyltransferase MocA